MLLGLRESRFSSWPSEGRGLFFMRRKLIVLFLRASARTRAHAGHMVTRTLGALYAAPVTH